MSERRRAPDRGEPGERITRRAALGRALGASLALPLWPLGCKDPEPEVCTSTKGLTEAQEALRTSMQYVDRSPDPKKTCATCQHWVPAARPDLCGGCKLIKGPFHPRGTCKIFAPTTT